MNSTDVPSSSSKRQTPLVGPAGAGPGMVGEETVGIVGVSFDGVGVSLDVLGVGVGMLVRGTVVGDVGNDLLTLIRINSLSFTLASPAAPPKEDLDEYGL